MAAASVALSLRGGTKSYGSAMALQDADFSLAAGEIRALLGKNGAGKSTLIKIISGVVRPNAGELQVAGETVVFTEPAQAIAAGIVTVHQELSVVPNLSVAENIVLGSWPKSGPLGGIDETSMRATARRMLDELGEQAIGVDTVVEDLTAAQQQLVEIARALALKPRVLLLDEPFSSLSAAEVALLKDKIRAIAASGIAVVFVSHRLGEVKDIAHTATIVRDGRVIDTVECRDLSIDDIARLLIGTSVEVAEAPAPLDASNGAPRLRLRNMRIPPKIASVDLDLWPGEVVGIAGLLGSGRSELLRAIAGIETGEADVFEIDGKPVSSSSIGGMSGRGVYFTPEDRKREGMVAALSVVENLFLPSMAQGIGRWALPWRQVRGKTAGIVRDLHVKIPGLDAEMTELSGGNQQKVVIGKWIMRGGARIFLFDEPTRGVDIQARAQIQDVLKDLAAQGTAILIVSSEVDELFGICHRILVLAHGRITRDLATRDTSIDEVTAIMMQG